MNAEERQQQILTAVETRGRVSVTELAQHFDVATETIRRDLDALDRQGLLARVHGGAIPRRTRDIEPDLGQRLSTNTEAKRAIAAAASRFIPTGSDATVLLDAGSTTVEMIPHLDGHDLRIVTNSLPIAEAALSISCAGVHILPGVVRGLTRAAVGVDTVKALSRLHPDVAFIGCNGMGEDGFTTPDPDEAAGKSAIVAGARRRIVLADSSKSGVSQLVTFAELDEVDVLVTDSHLPDSHLHTFTDSGIEVVRA